MTRARPFDSVPLKLAAFAVVLVVAFVAAFGVGSAVGPVDVPSTTSTVDPGPGATDGSRDDADHISHDGAGS